MPRTRTGIEARLARAQLAITNALGDSDLQAALATYGYGAERLRQGDALRVSAQSLYQQQRGEYGNLFTASDTLDTAQRQAQDTYTNHVKVAQVALKGDRGAQQKLGLASQRKRALALWLAQAQQFYANALPDPEILDRLAAFGVTRSLLEAGQRQVEAVAASAAARQQRKGAAQDATRARNDAMAALDAWMSDFLKIARIALKQRPQLLEKLGVAVPARRAPQAPAPVTVPTVAIPASAILSADAESEAVPAGVGTTSLPTDRSPAAERRNGRATVNGRA